MADKGISPDFTSKSLQEEPEYQPRLIQFLKQADILVSEIRVQEQEIDPDEIRPYLPAKILEDIEDLEGTKIRTPEFGLPVKWGDDLAYLELDEQSDGTRRVYSFAGRRKSGRGRPYLSGKPRILILCEGARTEPRHTSK